ncbi:uncharacterized protein LOC113852694 [Abrus precatorius]|uniref:Uncharacterized protein LOC113852694 n=1 Tax=Abrus precatorius TaxID=3816 RepID=A0A8B8K6F8_ABRPR|nr:uncharacterized protein LOC113852694 [Abrus precatorius]
MEGSKSMVLKFGGSSLQVNATTKKGKDNMSKCFTYTRGWRFLSLNITLLGNADRINNVLLEISENNGKGSSANLGLRVVRNDRYGVLCKMSSEFLGSYDSYKDNYCVPPYQNTELFHYMCHETGSAGFFSLEKKVNKEVVESVKAIHAFVVGDETLNVKTKITYDKRVGLIVEVEDPVKLTTDYMFHVFSKAVGKMESEMDASTLPGNGKRLPRTNGIDNEFDYDDDDDRISRTLVANSYPCKPNVQYEFKDN